MLPSRASRRPSGAASMPATRTRRRCGTAPTALSGSTGGVGYTWDCDAHLFLRRAKVDDLLLGYQGWQRARVADLYFASL